jgi:hypothetical protein
MIESLAATEDTAVDTTPQVTTPPLIDQTLVNMPVFIVRDAAEALGDLAYTMIAGTKTAKITNKQKVTTSSPAALTRTTQRNQRQVQERS